MTDNMVCSVCRKPKHSLRTRKSKLASVPLFLCDNCYSKEPRWAIILVARRDGNASVAHYVRNRLYDIDENGPILLEDTIE